MDLSLVGEPTAFDDGARFYWQSPGAVTAAIVSSSLFVHIFECIPSPTERTGFVEANMVMLLATAHAKAERDQQLGRTVFLDEGDWPDGARPLESGRS